MSLHFNSKDELISIKRQKKLRSELNEIQLHLESLYSSNKNQPYQLKKIQKLSKTRYPSVSSNYTPKRLTTNLNSSPLKELSYKKVHFNLPTSIAEHLNYDSCTSQVDPQKKISLLEKEITALKEKLELAQKEKKMLENEKIELNSLSTTDLLELTDDQKLSFEYMKNLENELKTEKEKARKYKALYECEKENIEIVKIESLMRMEFIENFNNENFESNKVVNQLILRNKELYDQVIRLSDNVFECRIQIKELTYQRDQVSDKLKELSIQINELPEVRKHVIALLNFINTIKAGLKTVSDREINYFDKNQYKEEISSLISQISSISNRFNFKELIARSEFGKGLLNL